MAGGVKLSFPAFDAEPALTKYFGTMNFEVDGEEYQYGLSEMPYVKTQMGTAQDTADFSINDPKNEIYDEIRTYEDVFEDTEVVVKECLKTSLGIFESDIVHNGFIERTSISDSNHGLNISSIADTSKTGNLVGGRILTARNCGWPFNKNGAVAAHLHPCGWQTAQGGNPLFCSHKLKGVDGCEAHNNVWRYGAVPALTTAPVVYVGDGGIGGTGWETGGGPCFLPRTLVWMADGSYKPIYKVEAGDKVWGFGLGGRVRRGVVLDNFNHVVSSYNRVEFGRGRQVGTTYNHLFNVDVDAFSPIGALEAGDRVRNYDTARETWEQICLMSNGVQSLSTRVHNLSVAELGTYFVVVGNLKIGVHNTKILINEF